MDPQATRVSQAGSSWMSLAASCAVLSLCVAPAAVLAAWINTQAVVGRHAFGGCHWRGRLPGGGVLGTDRDVSWQSLELARSRRARWNVVPLGVAAHRTRSPAEDRSGLGARRSDRHNTGCLPGGPGCRNRSGVANGSRSAAAHRPTFGQGQLNHREFEEPMADPVLHIKDSYYFEVPKMLYPYDLKHAWQFPPVWISLDPEFQDWEFERLYQKLSVLDLGLPRQGNGARRLAALGPCRPRQFCQAVRCVPGREVSIVSDAIRQLESGRVEEAGRQRERFAIQGFLSHRFGRKRRTMRLI